MSEVKANKISPATSTVVTLGDSSDTFVVTTGAKLDINGTELILDADADTSITADTDDQIDAGGSRFKNSIFTKWCRHIDDRSLGTRLVNSLLHRIEDRDIFNYRGASSAWSYTSYGYTTSSIVKCFFSNC